MSERLSYLELVCKYPAEYVILEDAILDEKTKTISGIPRWHGKDRREGMKRMRELKESKLTLMLCEARVISKG